MKIDLSNAQKLQEIKGWGTSACWWSQACPKGEITDVTVDYSEKYADQMLRYSADYGFLPYVNE